MTQPDAPAAPRIAVQATGSLKQQLPLLSQQLTARTVSEALRRLDLPRGVEFIPMIDGRVAHWDSLLHEGDILQLVPIIGGG